MEFADVMLMVEQHIRNEKQMMAKAPDHVRENIHRHGVDVLELLRRKLIDAADKVGLGVG